MTSTGTLHRIILAYLVRTSMVKYATEVIKSPLLKFYPFTHYK